MSSSLNIEVDVLEGVSDPKAFEYLRIQRGHFRDLPAGSAGKTKATLKPSCSKKVRYRDRQEALEALHRLQKVREYKQDSGNDWGHRQESRAYSCPSCRGAHLTSKRLHASPELILMANPEGGFEPVWELPNVA